MNQYGQRIKLIRDERGMPQIQFAEILGVDTSHIWKPPQTS